MGDRRRAVEEAKEDLAASKPAPVRPVPAGNREAAERLTGARPVGKDDVAGLAVAGNRAVAQLVKADDKAVEEPPPIAWIDALPDEIRRQIDSVTPITEKKITAGTDQKLNDMSARNRTTFMLTMRWLMGTYDAVEAHFKDVKPMANDQKNPLWAHVATRERLLEVQEDLKSQDVPMPQTDVGLGMRGDHLHKAGKSPGWFTHAVGFAVDWRAYRAPRISDPALIALFETVTGGPPQMRTSVESDKRIDLEIQMGQGKADATESKKLLDSIETEYKRLAEGSEKFTTDLPAQTLDRLRAVEQARVAVDPFAAKLDDVKKNRKSTPEQIAAAQKAYDDAKENYRKVREAVVAELPKLFEPWTKKLDTRIAEIDKIAEDAGVDLNELTGKAGFAERAQHIDELTLARRTMTVQATKDAAAVVRLHHDTLVIEARVDAARAGLAAATKPPPEADQWNIELSQVEQVTTAIQAGLGPARLAIGAIVPKAELEARPVPSLKAAISQGIVSSLHKDADKLTPRLTAVAGKANAETAKKFADAAIEIESITKDVEERRAYRREKITELGGGADAKSQAKGSQKVEALLDEKVKWLALKGARKGLVDNAGDFVLMERRETHNPAITQLLGLKPGTNGGGFFVPDSETGGEADAKAGRWSSGHGFNLAFMKSMVSHGFELGVAWRGGSDPMHFELAEGRRYLTGAGKDPLVAGVKLREQEEAAAKRAEEEAKTKKAP